VEIGRRVSSLVAPFVYKAIGMDFFRFHQWLESTSEWSLEERTQWRLEKLNQMINYCWNHVPFYQSLWDSSGLSNKALQSLDDLNSFPVVTKNLMKDSDFSLHSDDFHKIRKKLNSTGGTTGQPLQYSQDIELWSLSQAYNLWGWGLAGYKFGHKVAIVGGYSLVPAKAGVKERFRYFLDRKIPISGVHFDNETGKSIFSKLLQERPEFIYGYPSVLSMFGQYLTENNLRVDSVRAVFTTAEMLQNSYRENIENGFGCSVWDQYGCNDGGIMAHECSLHKGHHYNDLQVIAEIGSADSEDPGALIITNLWNQSFPFIRYANGDYVSISSEPCPCGEPFPVLSSIKGRTADILVFSNGRKLAGPALTLIFRDMNISGWQVIQTTMDSLEVHISNSEPLGNEIVEYIKLAFSTHVGSDIDVDIKEVTELQRTVSGKLKPVINAIPKT